METNKQQPVLHLIGQNQPIAFNFQGNRLFNVVLINDEPWFIAIEVADILEYSDAHEMTKKLDDDEVQNRQIAGFGNRGVNLINESGLYSSILTSQKPLAKPFKKWVTSEVLPSIRKTGQYSRAALPGKTIRPIGPSGCAQLRKFVDLAAASKEIYKRTQYLNVIKSLCDAHGIEMADPALIGTRLINDSDMVTEFFSNIVELEDLGYPLNHSVHPNKKIAINLDDYYKACKDRGIKTPPYSTLKQELRKSERFPFDKYAAIHSNIQKRTVRCWIFNLHND